MKRFRTCGASERQLQCGTSGCQAASYGASGRQCYAMHCYHLSCPPKKVSDPRAGIIDLVQKI